MLSSTLLATLVALLHIPVQASTACDPTCIRLRSKEVWRREEGWWVGNYTFLGADGKPFQSERWPYGYAMYHGFIHLELDGPCLKQRNVFIYPPLPASDCSADDNVVGGGTCGVNGNERVFEADQVASDCEGNLAGGSDSGVGAFQTQTTVTLGKDDTVLFQVRLPEGDMPLAGELFQNQLTTVGADGTRVRTAQGIIPGTGRATSASFFREEKVSEKRWRERLAEVRRAFNVREEDYCAWDIAFMSTGKTCEEHFSTEKCAFDPKRSGCRKARKRFRSEKRKCVCGRRLMLC